MGKSRVLVTTPGVGAVFPTVLADDGQGDCGKPEDLPLIVAESVRALISR
jgi:hypothetical protein